MVSAVGPVQHRDHRHDHGDRREPAERISLQDFRHAQARRAGDGVAGRVDGRVHRHAFFADVVAAQGDDRQTGDDEPPGGEAEAVGVGSGQPFEVETYAVEADQASRSRVLVGDRPDVIGHGLTVATPAVRSSFVARSCHAQGLDSCDAGRASM
jgi:hypothetical protein